MSTPLPTQESLLESLKRDQDRFNNFVQRLSEEQQLAPISPEGWSVKDFLAHMAHWKAATHALLVAYTHDQPLPDVTSSGDETNAEMRQQDAKRTLQDVHAYWKEFHMHLVHLMVDELDDKRLAEAVRPPWGGHEEALCVIVAEIIEHDREHFLLIERLIG
ncbi:MAG: hypothetical protein NVS4B12_03540 [Ktedonobacteraceae bacterium]